MNNTQTSFFIRECSKGEMTALPDRAGGRELSRNILQAIATANESFEQATARLIRLADLAYGQRDYEALPELGDALAAIPFAPARRAAVYYQAVLMKRTGQLDTAASMLATISAPRALLTLGTIEETRGNCTEAARLHVEAMRAGRGVDPFTVTGAAMQLATIRAVEGDHAGALYGFQSLWPMVRTVAKSHPYLFAVWHNAVAVELAELGRVDEARAAVAVATASPVANRYPEFEQTAAELRQAEAARVVVAVVEPKAEQGSEAGESQPTFGRVLATAAKTSSFIIQHLLTRANPRASPRAPPSFVK